jgi:hypothetical protein
MVFAKTRVLLKPVSAGGCARLGMMPRRGNPSFTAVEVISLKVGRAYDRLLRLW